MLEATAETPAGAQGSRGPTPRSSAGAALRSPAVVFLVAIAFGAGLYFLLLTPSGLYQYPDSVAYVGAAHNLIDGHGITLPFVPPDAPTGPSRAVTFAGRAPLYQYSPLLPVVLAGPIGAGVDAFAAARVLNALCWGATAALAAWATLRLTRGSYIAAGLTVFLLVTTSWYIAVQTALLTEPLFIVLCMCALGVLARCIAAPSRRLEIAFVALAAAAALSRYLGVAVIGTGLISILIWYPKPAAARVRRALALGMLAIAPLALWTVLDGARSGGGRPFAFHPPKITELHKAENSVAAWLTAGTTKEGVFRGLGSYTAPSTAQRLFTVVFILSMAGALVAITRKNRRNMDDTFDTSAATDRSLVRVGALFLTLYVGFLYLTISFVDASPAFGDRMFAPLPAVFWPLAVAGLWRVVRARRSGPLLAATSLASVLLLAVVLAWHVSNAPEQFRRARESASWFTRQSRVDMAGPMVQALRQLPSGDVVFTGPSAGVYQATKRFSIVTPQPTLAWTGTANSKLAVQEAEMGAALCAHRGVVAVFGPPSAVFLTLVPPQELAAQRRAFEQTVSRLERVARLHVIGTYTEGDLLGVDPARCTR